MSTIPQSFPLYVEDNLGVRLVIGWEKYGQNGQYAPVSVELDSPGSVAERDNPYLITGFYLTPPDTEES